MLTFKTFFHFTCTFDILSWIVQSLQTMMLTIVFLIYFIAFAILRPFRVKVFNGVLMVNTFCLMANILTGALRSSFDVYR